MRQSTRERDDAGFTAFVAANTPRLIHVAELLTGSPHDAPDLVQAALIKVYPHWRRIGGDDPVGYTRRVMINHQNDWWRRKRPREVLTERLPEAADRSDPADDHALRVAMLAALAALTRRERQVVVLRFYCDLTEPAIAAELGIAVGTVKSTLSRALNRLREMPELVPLPMAG
ncbi:SigE family RNA polymerase sigma factor [Catenulispora rubra]|uniref:SigE family RNA polymerase sigma factor n=1 Tax=Catenulispora rubra TaxID=280293 RepID=UPI0018927A5C|nr:SigE family RNA polymerase sigma factor [Catenulispora rubra]